MSALSGQVMSIISNSAGTPVLVATWFYDESTNVLHDSTAAWTSPTGKVWPAGLCLIADNQLGRTISVTAKNPGTGTVRTFSIASSGRSLTADQLSKVPPPNGPVNMLQDLNGLTFDLS